MSDAPVTIDTITAALDDFTIDEIEELETALGTGFDQFSAPGSKKAPLLRAVAWIVGKRDNPDFTLEDAGRIRITMSEAEVPPTPASAS